MKFLYILDNFRVVRQWELNIDCLKEIIYLLTASKFVWIPPVYLEYLLLWRAQQSVSKITVKSETTSAKQNQVVRNLRNKFKTFEQSLPRMCSNFPLVFQRASYYDIIIDRCIVVPPCPHAHHPPVISLKTKQQCFSFYHVT